MARRTNAKLQQDNELLTQELDSKQQTIKYLQNHLDIAHKEIREYKDTNSKINKTAEFFRKRTNYTANMTDTANADISDLDYINIYLNSAIVSWQEDNKKYQERYTDELRKTILFKQRVKDFKNTLTIINNVALSGK